MALKSYISYRLILLIGSWIFYASWNPYFLLLLIGSTIVDFLVGKKIAETDIASKKKLWLSVSLIFNLGALGFFKYAQFFIQTFNDIFNLGFPYLDIILPMGISFYTFQTLSYTFEIYFGRQKPHDNFLDFALFVAFFPQLVAGPIVRATHFLPQIKKTLIFKKDDIVWATQRFIWGLSKKLLIADPLGITVDNIYRYPESFSGLSLAAASLFFAVQLYVDFSAYSDMAIALARLFGFHIPENFNNPFFAKNISDFWHRWHISLSTWLRDYLYIPLGGNRGTKFLIFRNLLITMILGGLWHGANWGFILWGLYHGLLLVGYRLFSFVSLPTLLSRAITFVSVVFGFIFFRAETAEKSISIFKKIGLLLIGQNTPGKYWVPLNHGLLLTFLVFIGCFYFHLNGHKYWQRLPASFQAFLIASILWLALALAPSGHRPFYYFIF